MMLEIEPVWCRLKPRRSTAFCCWQIVQTKCSQGQPAANAAAKVGYIQTSAPTARRPFQMSTISFARRSSCRRSIGCPHIGHCDFSRPPGNVKRTEHRTRISHDTRFWTVASTEIGIEKGRPAGEGPAAHGCSGIEIPFPSKMKNFFPLWLRERTIVLPAATANHVQECRIQSTGDGGVVS
jgi:hypothetical protein